jgi:hypothetical protein
MLPYLKKVNPAATKPAPETQDKARHLDDVLASVGSGIGSARTINGNLDWTCGHCGFKNFARVIVCARCQRPMDHLSVHEQEGEKRARKHAQMMRLVNARMNQPSASEWEAKMGGALY